MAQVVLALADVGFGVQLQEALEAAGCPSTWDSGQAEGPRGASHADVVVLDADALGARLPDIVAAWRGLDPAPGLVAIGRSRWADSAGEAHITLLGTDAPVVQIRDAIVEAQRLRFTAAMTPGLARRALGLPGTAGDEAVLARTREMNVELPRAALRWHVQHYCAGTEGIARLREARALTIPEVEFCAHLDGTNTVQSLVKRGPIDGYHAARLIWALTSLGATVVTPEPCDRATPARRRLAVIRDHLRARMDRLEKSTFYDVLEVPPTAEDGDIEAAYQLVGRRYAPKLLANLDLAELAPHVEPMWQLVEKSRTVLLDIAARGRYNDWLRSKWGEIRTVWAVELTAPTLAADAYARAQKALAEGEIHRAFGDLAAACRSFPGHPEYETALCWARYRVQVSNGKDRAAVAKVERNNAERFLGGTRPWPRALLALALLSAADNDPESARYHLRESLSVDPNQPAAQQLLSRLGNR